MFRVTFSFQIFKYFASEEPYRVRILAQHSGISKHWALLLCMAGGGRSDREKNLLWVCAVSSEWWRVGRRRRDCRRKEKTVGGQMVGEQCRCCTACHVLSVVPSPLPRCCVARSGPCNICHFVHRLSAAKFRLQACRNLLNVQQPHRPKETAGLTWQPELAGGPVHPFLRFCEVSEPASSPSAAKPCACRSVVCEKRQDVEYRRCPAACVGVRQSPFPAAALALQLLCIVAMA